MAASITVDPYLPSGTFGGVYQHYIRASSDAYSGWGSGSAFFVELQNPQFGSTGACTATLAMYEYSSTGSGELGSAPVTCGKTTVMRTVVFGSTVSVLINGQVFYAATSMTSGAPGLWRMGSSERQRQYILNTEEAKTVLAAAGRQGPGRPAPW